MMNVGGKTAMEKGGWLKDKLGASNTSLRLDVLRTVQNSLEVLMIAIQEDKRSDLMK